MRRLIVLLAIFAAACGKRGDPHPPVPVIPKTTTDLVVAQRGTKLMLSWSYPSLTTSGEKLTSIRRIVVYRYVEEMPVAQPPRDAKTLLPGDIDPTIPTAIALFAKIPPIGPLQFVKLREKVDSIEGSNLTDSTVGARLVYQDSPPFQTTDGRPVRVNYAVVTEGATAKSDTSNVVSIVPINVASPPASVTAQAKPEGVVISWTAPETAINGKEKPRIAGYNVYRYAGDQELEELAVPVNAAPVSATTYTDVPSYGAYNYRVTAIAAVGPPRIESDPSDASPAAFRDLLPPPTPTGLTVLVETVTARVVWDAVSAPDLAGYRVYRTEVAGPERKFVGRLLFTPQLLKEPSFSDKPAPGIEYVYEVTAVDTSGNESAPARSDWVLVPRAP